MTLRGVERGGTLRLDVRPGVPGLAPKFMPRWPFAAYDLSFSGKLKDTGYAEVSIFVGMTERRAAGPKPRLFYWDGETYSDVTRGFHKEFVTGRNDALGSFVVMYGILPKEDH